MPESKYHKAYVLCRVRPGKEEEVADGLVKIYGIVEVNHVYGDCDLIITVKGKDLSDLEKIVSKVRKIKGLENTTTYIVREEHFAPQKGNKGRI